MDDSKKTTKSLGKKCLASILSNDENVILIVFIVIIGIVSAILPRFRTFYNILIVIRQFSLITIVSMGQAIVLISGGFDLSVGNIVALTNMAVAYMMVFQGWPIWLSVILAILIGTTCGIINGLLVAKIKINPLIATLAMGWVYSGVILVTAKGWPITDLPKGFNVLGQGYFLGIPLPIYFLIVIAIVLSIFLSKTINGRYLYAIGGSEKASLLAGLNTSNLRMLSYSICGFLAGFSGVVLASRMGTAQANAGEPWTLPTVAAAVIGGVSLFGGKGRIYGVLIGGAILGVINNILVLMKISAYWQTLISGFILLFAVSIDAMRKRRELLI
jgi:ribose transport system permease protein